MSANYTTAHGKAGSLTHQVGPGIEPLSFGYQSGLLPLSHHGNSSPSTFRKNQKSWEFPLWCRGNDLRINSNILILHRAGQKGCYFGKNKDDVEESIEERIDFKKSSQGLSSSPPRSQGSLLNALFSFSQFTRHIPQHFSVSLTPSCSAHLMLYGQSLRFCSS